MTAIRNIELADDRSRTELEDTLSRLRAEWPHVHVTVDIKPRAEVFTDPLERADNMGTMAQTEPDHGRAHITLIKEYVEDFAYWQDQFRDGIRNGTLSPKMDAEHPAAYVLSHEWGHAMHAEAFGQIGYGIEDDLQPEGSETDMHFRRAFITALEAVGVEAPDIEEVPFVYSMAVMFQLLPELAADLSGYGAYGGPNELVAESFAFHHLLPGASKAADAVYTYLVTAYDQAHAGHDGHVPRTAA